VPDSTILLSYLVRYTLVRMETRIQTLERRIAKITMQLAQLGDLRIGSLSEQYNVCGRAGCRCKASPPIKHGPYHQLSFTRKGKSSTRFVRRGELTTVKQQLRNYEKLRKLVDQWITLGTELSNLKLDQQRKSRSQRAG
jgi:hypothetical protein